MSYDVKSELAHKWEETCTTRAQVSSHDRGCECPYVGLENKTESHVTGTISNVTSTFQT